MGGSVSCRSAPGAGTTFEVRLPGPANVLEERPHRVDPKISAAVKDKFVAILDDDAELLKSTERLFESRGVHVLCARDPVPWLNGLAEVQRMPDLFLMDYQLKGQDVELTLNMVKRKWSDKNPRIIVLTGHLSNPSLQRISRSTPVLRKPLKRRALQSGARDPCRPRHDAGSRVPVDSNERHDPASGRGLVSGAGTRGDAGRSEGRHLRGRNHCSTC